VNEFLTGLLLLGSFTVAFANGANSVFKGVATIYGSGVATYRIALAWATLTTFAGSVASIFVASELLKRFSGQGLVPDILVAAPPFLVSVALGTGITVVAATRLGMPVSTTHALFGALAGAAATAVGITGINFGALIGGFVVPLFFSPIIGAGVAAALYLLLPLGRFGLHKASLNAAVNPSEDERSGLNSRLLDSAHFMSAGIVSFARGLNDTPKMAALLLMLKWLAPELSITLVGGVIAIGGILGARRVAETLSHKITSLNPEQGFVANLTTGVLVLVASPLGLPVATTHISACSLFGIGLVTGHAQAKTIMNILASWVITVPLAALITAVAYAAISRLL
jgi:inorganic phosphate transporter, PiT family